jgi:EAL domain-containing protein (putative c-di-GMP-specific phosphodiesterase class I)
MVENKRECEHLKALNVHWLQGDYISRQKPLDYTDK